MKTIRKVFGYIKVERYVVNQDEELFMEIINPDEKWEGNNSITMLYTLVQEYFKNEPLEKSYEKQSLSYVLYYTERDNLLNIYLDKVTDFDEISNFIVQLYAERKAKLNRTCPPALNTRDIA